MLHAGVLKWPDWVIIADVIDINTHGTKKKQHVCTSSGLHDHYSELLTSTAPLKLLKNTVTKPLFQPSLSYYKPSTF